VDNYNWTISHHHLCSVVGVKITSFGRVMLSCPDYLFADVSDGGDLSLHQQEVTDGQLVTKSLVSSTVDSDAVLEVYLCCAPPLPTG